MTGIPCNRKKRQWLNSSRSWPPSPCPTGSGCFTTAWAGGFAGRSGRQLGWSSPAEDIADLPQDSRYETTLATARAIIHQFTDRADMPGHERLARVTYTILEAMRRHEERRQAGLVCQEPSVN